MWRGEGAVGGEILVLGRREREDRRRHGQDTRALWAQQLGERRKCLVSTDLGVAGVLPSSLFSSRQALLTTTEGLRNMGRQGTGLCPGPSSRSACRHLPFLAWGPACLSLVSPMHGGGVSVATSLSGYPSRFFTSSILCPEVTVTKIQEERPALVSLWK